MSENLPQVEDVTEVNTSKKPSIDVPENSTPKSTEVNQPIKITNLIRIEALYENIVMGQKEKGALSMQDCRALKNARSLLQEFFAEDEDAEERTAGQPTVEAFSVFIKALQALQSTGVYSIDGSVLLLELLEILEKAIDERKDTSYKMKEMQERLKAKKNKKKF